MRSFVEARLGDALGLLAGGTAVLALAMPPALPVAMTPEELDLRAAECGLTHRPSDGVPFNPDAPCIGWPPVPDSNLLRYAVYRVTDFDLNQDGTPERVEIRCHDTAGPTDWTCLRGTSCTDGPFVCVRAVGAVPGGETESARCSPLQEVLPCACVEIDTADSTGWYAKLVRACEVPCRPGDPDRLPDDEREIGPCP